VKLERISGDATEYSIDYVAGQKRPLQASMFMRKQSVACNFKSSHQTKGFA
jgi:hypothetical protein